MKKLLSALISVLVAGTPVLALANDGSDDSGTSGSGHSSVEVGDDHGGLRASFDARIGNSGKGSDDFRDRAKGHAHDEIERRIDALNRISLRIDDAKRISIDDKASLVASIEAQIDALNDLKAKIEADDTTDELRADIQSITKSHRVFALVLPQTAITAAADRVLTVAGQMETFSAKLEARIDAATDVDTDELNDKLADYDAKVADAKVKANAAIDIVDDLDADEGDSAALSANVSALKDARAKIVAAQADLKAAREDARFIAAAVKGHGEVEVEFEAH